GSCGRYPTVAIGGFSDTLPASRAPSSSPASIRSSVDFPAPLAPTSPITLPGDTTRSAPEKMTRSACPADSPLAVSTAFTRLNLGQLTVLPGRPGRDMTGHSGNLWTFSGPVGNNPGVQADR